MEIPIIFGGERCGTVETRREGAYTVFEARCAPREGIVRLYVFGPGGRGCLGVLCPEGGELRLRRRFSRAEMKGFPRSPEYASAEPQSRGSAPAAEAPRGVPSAREGEWLERADGSLILEREGRRMIALPCSLRREIPGTRTIERGGRRYMVFRY